MLQVRLSNGDAVGCTVGFAVVVGCCNADSLAAAALVVSRYPLVFDGHLKENNQNNQSLLLQVRTVATLVDVVLRGSLASLGCIQDVLQHIPQSPPG